MENTIFYWLPSCSTCQKAKNFIERHGVKFSEVRDIKENPLSPVEINKLAAMLGGVNELFSRRAIKYRELKLSERTLSDKEMFDLMTEEYTFLKRPILEINGRAIAGFFERTMNQFLDENYYQK